MSPFLKVQVTCVERDPQMIEVANTYFQLPIENERLQMVSMDVTEYLRTNQQKGTKHQITNKNSEYCFF